MKFKVQKVLMKPMKIQFLRNLMKIKGKIYNNQ